MPRSSIAGLYGLFFWLFENSQTDFHSGYTSLHSFQWNVMVPFPHILSPASVVICFLVDSHSHWGEMESQSNINLHFPDGEEC